MTILERTMTTVAMLFVAALLFGVLAVISWWDGRAAASPANIVAATLVPALVTWRAWRNPA